MGALAVLAALALGGCRCLSQRKMMVFMGFRWLSSVKKLDFLMGFLEFKHETWEDHGMMGGFG